MYKRYAFGTHEEKPVMKQAFLRIHKYLQKE